MSPKASVLLFAPTHPTDLSTATGKNVGARSSPRPRKLISLPDDKRVDDKADEKIVGESSSCDLLCPALTPPSA